MHPTGLCPCSASFLSYAPQERIQQAWETLKAIRSSMVILNGVWSAVPDGAPEVKKWSAHCHVIVADDFHLRPENLAEFSPPRHFVQLSLDKADRLQLVIQLV